MPTGGSNESSDAEVVKISHGGLKDDDECGSSESSSTKVVESTCRRLKANSKHNSSESSSAEVVKSSHRRLKDDGKLLREAWTQSLLFPRLQTDQCQ